MWLLLARVSSEKHRYEVGMFVKCIGQNLRHHNLCDKSVVTLAFLVYEDLTIQACWADVV